jgi:hypothetical protein
MWQGSWNGRFTTTLERSWDYCKQGELKIGMTKYGKSMLVDFLVKLPEKKDTERMPAGDSLFKLGTGAKLQDTKRDQKYSTNLAKGLLLC